MQQDNIIYLITNVIFPLNVNSLLELYSRCLLKMLFEHYLKPKSTSQRFIQPIYFGLIDVYNGDYISRGTMHLIGLNCEETVTTSAVTPLVIIVK